MGSSISNIRAMKIVALSAVIILPLAFLLASPKCAYATSDDLTAGCNHVWVYDDTGSYAATYIEKGLKVWYCNDCGDERTKVIPKKKKTKAMMRASKPIIRFYKYAKKYNVGKMSACFKKKPRNAFFVTKRYLADICKKQNSKRMKCRLVDGTVGKKKATFTVEVRYRSGYEAFCKGMRAFYRAGVRYGIRYLEMPSDSWIDATLRKYITKYTKEVGFANGVNEFDIKVVKTRRGWKIAGVTGDIMDSVNCDYDSAWNDADI